MNAPAFRLSSRIAEKLPATLCLAAVVACVLTIDLKGISTDEGMRLAIVNGGRAFTPEQPQDWPTYGDVLEAVAPHAYQPAFYLGLNSLMRLFERQDLLFFRSINIGFLILCLWGLLALSRRWSAWPRTFLVALFAGNAYLFMHVLQVREYLAAVALYIWSTRLVLHLDRRELAREWRDVGCFVGYGLLLTAGFYLQIWTVFPAVAQGAFLVLRRRAQIARFLVHLALSYAVFCNLVWPYLRLNTQKVNVGLWASEQVTLLGQLSNGFHLVLSGHLASHSWFTTLLPIAWLALLAAGAWVLWRWRASFSPAFVSETARQSWLSSSAWPCRSRFRSPISTRSNRSPSGRATSSSTTFSSPG